MGKKGKQVGMLDDPQQLYGLKVTKVLTEWHNSFACFRWDYPIFLFCILFCPQYIAWVLWPQAGVMSISWTNETDSMPLLPGSENRAGY